MIFNSRAVAAIIALIVGIISSLFLFLATKLKTESVVFTFFVVYSATAISIYITLEYMIFRELNRVYTMMERLKKRTLNL